MEEMQNEIEIGKFTIPKTPMYFLNEIPEGIYLELEVISFWIFFPLFIFFIYFSF